MNRFIPFKPCAKYHPTTGACMNHHLKSRGALDCNLSCWNIPPKIVVTLRWLLNE